MSESLIRQMFARIDHEEWDELAACFHPGMSYERPGLTQLSGRERVMRFYREERKIADSRHDVQGVLLDGDRAASWGQMSGWTARDGPVSAGFAEIYQFKDGVLVSRRSYFFTPTV